jgi:hypothetical protein
LIKSNLLYGSETWRLTEGNKRRVEATEMDALRRSSRISRKDKIRNETIRQQIGLEETIIKEIEQNQLTWYGHVKRMAEGRLPKITLKWMPKQKRAQGRPKKNWMEGIKKAMNGRILKEGQWEDRKKWSVGVGQENRKQWSVGVGQEDRKKWSVDVGQENRKQWSVGVGQEDRKKWSVGVGQRRNSFKTGDDDDV